MPRNSKFGKGRKGFLGGGSITSKENKPIQLESLCTTTAANRPTIPLASIDPNKQDKVLSNQKFIDEEYKEKEFTYDLVDMNMFGSVISNNLRCSKCSSVNSLSIKTRKRAGLSSIFVLTCVCGFMFEFCNSKAKTYKSKEKTHKLEAINIAFVNATRLAGIGETAAKKICTFMSMPNPPSDWEAHQEILGAAYQQRADISKARATEESESDATNRTGSPDLTVSVDGSWMKRGRTSNVGFTSCIYIWLNKIIGTDVRHKLCPKCKGKKACTEECGINHKDSSGKMETVGATAIIMKIFKDFNLKVTGYLGDGDSKAFSSALNAAMQAGSWVIEKLECVNHVAKRIGGRLRKQKEKKKGLGGKGKLTNKAIDTIQRHYSWIIRASNGDVGLMQKRVMAMYHHIASTDEQPNHSDCEIESCKYLQAQEKNELFSHSKHFHIAPGIMQEVKSVFEDLSDVNLLRKCAHGKTQNANECFNSTVWNLLSKNGFANKQLAEMVVNIAVCLYNEGYLPVLDVLSSLGVPISVSMAENCKKFDQRRVDKKRKREEQSASHGTKKRKKNDDNDEDYQPGLGDYE